MTKTKFNIGDRVKAIKGSQMGTIGTIEKVLPGINTNTEAEYQVGFPTKPYGMTLPESSIQKVSKGDFTVYTTESLKRRGAISAVFIESDIITESADPSAIREVRHKDVTGKHFAGWFFKMDDWANITPSQFPLSLITHDDEIAVYGYFNGDKLDGIIRVDDYDDSYELSFFFVNKALQHQGIGQQLFQSVLNRYKDKKLILYVYKDNSPAIHIYKKYGFKITGTDYGRGYKPQSPHYIMQRDVNRGV